MESPGVDVQLQSLLSDLSVRMRDLDEKNRLIRERVLLLGKNLVEVRDEYDKRFDDLRLLTDGFSRDISLLKKVVHSLTSQLDRFVKRDDMLLLERMLKDFQPLEFMRRRDVERLLDERLGQNK